PVVAERTAEAIRVSIVGVSAERAAEIRAALAKLPRVTVEVADVRPASPTAGAAANPAADRILALSDTEMARAFAIRGLERRLPTAGVATLAAADRATLRTIFNDHSQAFDRSLGDLTAALQPRLPTLAADQEPRQTPGRDTTPEALLAAARALDQALN